MGGHKRNGDSRLEARDSEMLRTDSQTVDIDTILEPPLLLRDRDIVPAHLAFLHLAIGGEGPILHEKRVSDRKLRK